MIQWKGWKILYSQLVNPLNFILLFAALLSVYMKESSDAMIIMIIILLNAFLGFAQEFRSGRAIEKLYGLIGRKQRNNDPKITQHQKTLTEFSFVIMKIIVITVLFMLMIKVFSIHNAGDFAEIILFAIALVMTVVPEALPMITTVTLSHGALKLAKQKLLAKRLTSIEDLGRIDVLCIDLKDSDEMNPNIMNTNDKAFHKKLKISMKRARTLGLKLKIFTEDDKESGHKYRALHLLKKKGYIVGYQCNNTKDTLALGLADVSITAEETESAVKNTADIVLLENNPQVTINGVLFGRSIFVNINKYIQHAMIGNFGSFFSMIFFYIVFAADIPMLAIQVLIGNIIQDLPLMAISSDSVNIEEVNKPQAGEEVKSVMKTSVLLGIFTAVYYLIFFLYIGTQATVLTQTTLFLFYNITQLLIVLSIRNKHLFLWQGEKPSLPLLAGIAFFILLSVALTYIPVVAAFMGFTPLPLADMGIIIGVSILYLFLLDIVKIALSRF